MGSLFLPALGAWVIMLVFAIGNGTLRDQVLQPKLGDTKGLALSGLILSGLILLLSLGFVGLYDVSGTGTLMGLGLYWTVLMLAFEFLFGRYVAGMPVSHIVKAFDPRTGNLWSLVVLTTLFGPLIAGFFLS